MAPFYHILVLLLLLPLLGGCSATLTTPPPAVEPRAVFLLDHGRHSSLVLARADGGMVRYSYGDWRYYAHGQTSLWSSSRALLVPSRAALGRRELVGPAEEAFVLAQVRVVIERLIPLELEARRVDELITELDGVFFRQREQMHYREDYDLELVPYPRNYTLTHNSNRVVADWLRYLGVGVTGSALLSSWRVE